MHQPALLENRIFTPSKDSMIYFPYRSTALADSEKEKLRLYVKYLKQNPTTAVALIGRSDKLGNRSYDLAIAEEQSIVVSDFFRSNRVTRRQIRRYSIGNEKMSPTCRSLSCKQQYAQSRRGGRTMTLPSFVTWLLTNERHGSACTARSFYALLLISLLWRPV